MLHDVSQFYVTGFITEHLYWGTFIQLKYQYFNWIIVVAFLNLHSCLHAIIWSRWQNNEIKSKYIYNIPVC